jgi:hypothetical protein
LCVLLIAEAVDVSTGSNDLAREAVRMSRLDRREDSSGDELSGSETAEQVLARIRRAGTGGKNFWIGHMLINCF